jgi:uncharacterized protein (TIGR04255 family)
MYVDAPLIEAVCEFRFKPSSKWDFTVLGRFYEKIKNDFPEKENRLMMGAKMEITATATATLDLGPFIKFLRPDKSAIVEAGPDFLSIHYLAPYSAWNEFKSNILDILNKYKRITKPNGFQRIGLRYVNRVDLKGDAIRLTDYFRVFVALPNELPQNYNAVSVRTEIPYEDGRDHLVVILNNVPPRENYTLSLMLDFDYATSASDAVKLNQVAAWLENAHNVIESAFDASLTDRCKQMFAGD